ncbi:MAG: LptE family protein [Candidatus Cloacimonadaceae bacterium]|jgi:hypothetical protein
MVKTFITITMLLIVLFGCSYSVYSNTYPHLKKVRIAAFENRSSSFEIGENIFSGLNLQFRNDGRLKPVTQDPDCLIEGVINSFEENIHSYDASNKIQDYRLTLSLSISFTDLSKNETIWENKALSLSQTYAVGQAATSKNKSREEATNALIKDLFDTIIRNSLERW